MLRYFIWLSEVIPKGNMAVNHILDRFDTAKDFYLAFKENADTMDFLPPYIKKRVKSTPLSKADEIINRCEILGIKMICCTDRNYPKRLIDIDGIPLVLYYVGDISEIDVQPAIGVVGTRKASEQAMIITGTLCMELAASGINIISGCAVGIDEYAHRGAIKASARTVAVLGTGVDVDYPKKNAALKNKILSTGGLLISEQPPGTRGDKQNFPCRNRIIAGLSDSVIVTEAPKRSGALITARHAMEQGKDVFCLPPLEFTSSRYAGNVSFLRDGALPVYGAYEILCEYYKNFPDKINVERVMNSLETMESADVKPKQTQEVKPKLSGVSVNTQKLFEVMSATPIHLEQLSEMAVLTMSETLVSVTELEMMNVISQKAGRQYYIK